MPSVRQGPPVCFLHIVAMASKLGRNYALCKAPVGIKSIDIYVWEVSYEF